MAFADYEYVRQLKKEALQSQPILSKQFREDTRERAQLGDARAQLMHGIYLIDKDEKEAVKYILLSAEQGDGLAQIKIGDMYYNGVHGFPQNYEKALILYKKVNDNDMYSYTNAQIKIGDMYFDGVGISQNYKEALYFYKLAALDNLIARIKIGNMYYDGAGVPQDYKEALSWYLQATEIETNPDGPFYVGHMYYNGLGVRQDTYIAKEWFGKSCDNGNQNGCDMYKILNQ